MDFGLQEGENFLNKLQLIKFGYIGQHDLKSWFVTLVDLYK